MDSYQHAKLGRIQIKSSALEFGDGINYYEWKFDEINLRNCDTVFLACMDKYYKKYLRIYQIPAKDIRIKYIRINPNTESKRGWNRYEIDVKQFNDSYCKLSIEDCPVLKECDD